MASLTAAAMSLFFVLLLIAGWATNAVWTFGQTGWDIALGFAGMLIPFVGAFHGIYLWF